jgi:hypothetical protein
MGLIHIQQPLHEWGFYCSWEFSIQHPSTKDLNQTDDAVLLQELLMASRANDADGCNSWLALGIDELGREIAAEVESDVQLSDRRFGLRCDS